MQRHLAYANGLPSYKRDDDGVFSIDPYRFTPRSRHPRSQLQRRLVYGGVLFTLAILFFLFPSTRKLVPTFDNATPSYHSFEIETLRYYDLSEMGGSARGWEKEERVLLCTPLRDAEPHLPMFFSHLRNFTYPHHLIDLAFLVSDSKDRTEELLTQLLEDLQSDPNPQQPYGEISVIHKDFGQKVNQDVESRHGFAAQASRRKLMAQARNWLLSAALRPTHSWVYWRDADVETAPFTILEDLMRHNKDVIVPNVWRPLPDWLGGEQPYDLNSWQESETALALADTLDEDAVIVEGYAEYATWRPHLAYLRDPYGDPDMEMEIDGVGGVSILAKARVFRSGVHFPAFSFEKHAETEGFGKMAKRMHYSVVGLPHYTVWHLYEPSVDDIRHMEEMEAERKAREQEEKDRIERLKKIKEEFKDPNSQWEKDKSDIAAMAAADKVTEDKEMVNKAKAAVAAAGAAVGGHGLLEEEEEAISAHAKSQTFDKNKNRAAGAGVTDAEKNKAGVAAAARRAGRQKASKPKHDDEDEATLAANDASAEDEDQEPILNKAANAATEKLSNAIKDEADAYLETDPDSDSTEDDSVVAARGSRRGAAGKGKGSTVVE